MLMKQSLYIMNYDRHEVTVLAATGPIANSGWVLEFIEDEHGDAVSAGPDHDVYALCARRAPFANQCSR